MRRGRKIWLGAAALAPACALMIPATGQERPKDPAPDRSKVPPKERGLDGAQKAARDPAQKGPDSAKYGETRDQLKFFGDVVATLQVSYVVKPDNRKLVEAAIRGMHKEVGGRFEHVAQAPPDPAKSDEIFDHLQVFREAVAALEKNSAVKLDYPKLTEAAIRGMLGELDARSEYIDPQEFRQLWKGPIGGTAGIGIEMRLEGGRVQVVAALPGAPAERAKIGAGDVITHIDGRNLIGLTLDEARRLLTGPPGSTVVLKVLPAVGGQPRGERLMRENIRQLPV